ncbi:MAG TPA: hypothetical protein VEC57_14900 [Candidatus Limnocylindrales bacterium]|nr:hypothetical protein [Candidatus Limnocylindrales bacterium]
MRFDDDGDRPAHDGRMVRRVLRALKQPRTIADVAAALRWPWKTAHSWVHYLLRTGRVVKVGTKPGGRRAGVYQRSYQRAASSRTLKVIPKERL